MFAGVVLAVGDVFNRPKKDDTFRIALKYLTYLDSLDLSMIQMPCNWFVAISERKSWR